MKEKEKHGKKILMIGDGNHYFNRKLVEKLRQYNKDLTIDFFSITKPDKKLILPYCRVIDGSVSRSTSPYLFRLPGLYSRYAENQWALKLARYLESKAYDIVHLQGANHWIAPLVSKGAIHVTKVILTVWGSDFYRATKRRLSQLEAIASKVDCITFATERVSSDFNETFATSEKHKIVKFGLEVFDFIDKKRSQTQKNGDKIIVTVGYNRHPAQQHLAVIEALGKLGKEEKDKLKLVLPLTYGPSDRKYLAQIKKALLSAGIMHELLFEFMNEEEVALNGLKSDVMIQVQRTDAFSGSMQEYMYAGNIVITGSWLPYDELKESGVRFYSLDSLNEITDLMKEVIQSIGEIKTDFARNRDLLKSISSWGNNITKWNSLYDA